MATIYTDADNTQVEHVCRWLDKYGKPRSWLSKKTGIPSATMSQILSGKYPSSPSKQLAACVQAIEVEEARMADGPAGYVKGSVHKLVNVVCDRTRKHANIGVVTGFVGVGKTRTLKEYCAAKSLTLLVEASPRMTPGVLLTVLLEQLGTTVPPGLDRKFREVVRVIGGTNYLRAITPQGQVYTIGRNAQTLQGAKIRGTSELAGVCFSPDGSTLFVNIYSPGCTLAVTGPWRSFRA